MTSSGRPPQFYVVTSETAILVAPATARRVPRADQRGDPRLGREGGSGPSVKIRLLIDLGVSYVIDWVASTCPCGPKALPATSCLPSVEVSDGVMFAACERPDAQFPRRLWTAGRNSQPLLGQRLRWCLGVSYYRANSPRTFPYRQHRHRRRQVERRYGASPLAGKGLPEVEANANGSGLRFQSPQDFHDG